MKIGYARVSSKGQLDNNSLEEQENKLIAEGCDQIYKEQYTGTKIDRPEFNKAMEQLNAGDTLVVTKLDRFARTAGQGITLVKELMNKGIKIHILNMGIVEDTPIGRMVFNIMSSFAEFERDMIVERTQEGKAIARTKAGFKEGRPKLYTDTQINHALDLIQQGNSYTKVVDMTQISKATLTREMRKRKIAQLDDGK